MTRRKCPQGHRAPDGVFDMNKDQIISQIAAKHLRIGALETQKSDSLDFHEVAVWSVREALGAAYDAGRAAGAENGCQDSDEVRSGVWTQMTVDDAVEHLKTWIDNIDDPAQIALMMIHVCGCPRAAVIDGTHIAAELP